MFDRETTRGNIWTRAIYHWWKWKVNKKEMEGNSKVNSQNAKLEKRKNSCLGNEYLFPCVNTNENVILLFERNEGNGNTWYKIC